MSTNTQCVQFEHENIEYGPDEIGVFFKDYPPHYMFEKLKDFVVYAYEVNNQNTADGETKIIMRNNISEALKRMSVKIGIKLEDNNHKLDHIEIDNNSIIRHSKELLYFYKYIKNFLKQRTSYLNSLYNETYKKIYNIEARKKCDDMYITNYLNKVINTFDINGGKKSKKLPKKEILGKMRSIYKIPGDKKEYLKHKGKLITVKEYKELMKAKPKKTKSKK